jgi:hypothetical protein
MAKTRLSLIWASASWKNSIADLIKEKYGFVTPKHFTTRLKRPNEDDHYMHISQEEFIAKIIEWKMDMFTFLDGTFYGYADWDISSDRILYIIDPNGLPRLEKICLQNKEQLISIFLNVSDDLRKKRAEKRWCGVQLLTDRIDMDEYLSVLGEKYSQYTINSVEWLHNTFAKVETLLDEVLDLKKDGNEA